eukprot:COSAG04_NODE_659_length_11458_cov_3.404173_12_plen_559_part_00
MPQLSPIAFRVPPHNPRERDDSDAEVHSARRSLEQLEGSWDFSPERGPGPQPEPEPYETPGPEPQVPQPEPEPAAAKHTPQEGVPIGCVRKDWAIEHGFVAFTGKGKRTILDTTAHTFSQAHQAKFLKISGGDLAVPFTSLTTRAQRMQRVQQLQSVLTLMETEWGMRMPPMIISVTGNAAPFELRPKFTGIFNQALLMATQSTGAWVTTGGNNSGVMKLAGDAMKNATTPIIGIASWGVISGRARLHRPSPESIAARILAQARERNTHSARAGKVEDIGTADEVIKHYASVKARGWADPTSPPEDLGGRLSFLNGPGQSLGDLGMMNRAGYPDISLATAELCTGKNGRGRLGRWGPNHAVDTIVTRRDPSHEGDGRGALQVAMMFRNKDQMWAIPGKFVSLADAEAISRFEGHQRPESVSRVSDSQQDDKAYQIVREVFELEGIELRKATSHDLFDEIFKKSAQTLVYRGYSDDPRNTNNAWVETSAFHIHCPTDMAEELASTYKHSSRQIQWLDVVMTGQRIELFGTDGHKYDVFASHRELIEIAVFGEVHGLRGK